MQQIGDYCRQQQLPLVLGGDIFDSRRPDSESVQVFNNAVAGCRQPVYFVQGNHDNVSVPWPAVTDAATSIHSKAITLGGIRVYGLDWQPRGSLAAALDCIPEGVDVVVAHQAWEELQGIGSVDGSVSDVCADVLLTGDYHKQLELAAVRRDTGTPIRVLSPGSTHLCRFGEDPHKYLFVVGRQGTEVQWQKVPLETREYSRVRVESAEALEQLKDVVAAYPPYENPDARPVIQLRYEASLPGVVDYVQTVSLQAHWLLDAYYATTEIEIAVDAATGSFDSLCGTISQMPLDTRTQDIAQRLLQTPAGQLAETLQDLYTAFMAE
jgi:predicted phosphodiesterase